MGIRTRRPSQYRDCSSSGCAGNGAAPRRRAAVPDRRRSRSAADTGACSVVRAADRAAFPEHRLARAIAVREQHLEVRRQPAVVDGDRGGAVRGAELLEDAREMDLHGAFADAERARDHLVRAAHVDEAHDLRLSRRQQTGRRAARQCVRERLETRIVTRDGRGRQQPQGDRRNIVTAEQHHLERANQQMRTRGVRYHARDAIVEEVLNRFRGRVADQHRDGRRRTGRAQRLEFADLSDVQPVDRDEIEALRAQQAARLETVGRVVDTRVTVDLPQQALQPVTPLGIRIDHQEPHIQPPYECVVDLSASMSSADHDKYLTRCLLG